MKLTDLELCKRIAEIEGERVLLLNQSTLIQRAEFELADLEVEYNPLTNKDLLFDLMVKYNVCIDRGFAGVEKGLAEIWPKDIDTCSLNGTFCAEFECDSDIPRAILECIVEANK